jgi:glycopeptide antibiotics resistance protein
LLVLSGVILFKTSLSFAFLNIRFSFESSDIKRSINLIPFGGMLILNGKPSYNEIFFNGFMCMLRKKKTFVHLIMPIILTSLFYEAAQYIFAIGASDITDLLANILGGIVGFGIFFLFRKICKENVNKVINAAALVLTISLALIIGMIVLL